MSKKSKMRSKNSEEVLSANSLPVAPENIFPRGEMLERLICFSPLLVGAFTASGGFSHFRADTFIQAVGLIVALNFGLEIRSQPQRKKWLSFGLLLLAIVLFSSLTTALKQQHAFYVLAVMFASQILFFSIVVTNAQQLFVRSILRIFGLSSIALLGAITQSEVVIWGVMLLGYLPSCFLVAKDLIEFAPMLTSAGWQRTITVDKKGTEQRRPGGLTRLLSLAMVILPGLLLLPIPFAIIPSGFLLLGLLFYPALNIIQEFQDQTQSDGQLQKRALQAALLAALLMPVIALLSIA